MKKFAIAAATVTALTLTMANAAFAQTQATQAPMMLAAGEMTKAEEATSDTWITTKVKSDLLTEKGIPGTDIKVETNKGVVSLSSTVAVTDAQKATAVAITKKIKGVKAVSADGLKAEKGTTSRLDWEKARQAGRAIRLSPLRSSCERPYGCGHYRPRHSCRGLFYCGVANVLEIGSSVVFASLSVQMQWCNDLAILFRFAQLGIDKVHAVIGELTLVDQIILDAAGAILPQLTQ